MIMMMMMMMMFVVDQWSIDEATDVIDSWLFGVDEGLVVDWRHGRLVFTNEDLVTLDGVTYTWQRIETIRLDGSGRRAIVTTDIQRPRGLAVDSTQQSVLSPTVVSYFYTTIA